MKRWPACIALLATQALWSATPPADDPDQRADATWRAMTREERNVLTIGLMPLPFGRHLPVPSEAIPAAGYVPGLPRLGVPALFESDASLGVAWVLGLRHDGATALPSSLALAATWNPEVARAGGAMIAREALAKGFNVLLAGGTNLAREPRNGRNFEYLGEDPWLAGTLGGASIAGIQSEHVLATAKHFALNDQETARHYADVKIDAAAARESDLLAFEIAIEQGEPGSVMCAYNRVHGRYACENDELLDGVLKRDWAYPGFVMSDWGAVHSMEAALAGLDQESGVQNDPATWFEGLGAAAARDPAYAARLADMNHRILRSIYAVGLDRHPPRPGPVDYAANGRIAQEEAEQGIVLLRNRDGLLPLQENLARVAVIGGYADSGVVSGGGSSQVQGPGGPAVAVPLTGDGEYAAFLTQNYHRSAPLRAIRAHLPGAQVTYRDGRYITDAVDAARAADVAIVFATQWMTEGADAPDLSLPSGQDALIEAVARANPRTVVVLETGGPVLMPWLAKSGAVLEAWYPGARGGEAIAAVLFGEVDPSGRLPMTFPASVEQLPRPRVDGQGTIAQDYASDAKPAGPPPVLDYDIEGADVGYRWYAHRGLEPLFPFGYGLSYTRFEAAGLEVGVGDAVHARFHVANTGARAGATVAQLYLVSAAGAPVLRLAAYERVALREGESRELDLPVDWRLLAHWRDGQWRAAAGRYEFALGQSAAELGSRAAVELKADRCWAALHARPSRCMKSR